jgi:hypothetical protein
LLIEIRCGASAIRTFLFLTYLKSKKESMIILN